jgi:hypothetical protein
MGNNSKSLIKFNDYIINKMDWLIKRRIDYTPLDNEEYLERFGIAKEEAKLVIRNDKLLERAYVKAWENRNFEIDKFWTRAAYFWGFIVLIFGGYITLLTSEHNQKAIDMHIDLYLLLLGFLFSLTWYLVIRGSKCWQENWEAHIDHLEDLYSGPIYRTIHYSGRRFYSVSKLNEVMALVVILVWCSIFYHYASMNLEFTMNIHKIDFQITLPIIVTLVFAIVLRFGYCMGHYKSAKNSFFDRWEKYCPAAKTGS